MRSRPSPSPTSSSTASNAPDFGRLAAAYDELRPADDNWREVFELVVEQAGLRGARVLDAGCGTGRLAAELAEAGIARVWGVDRSSEMLAVARAKTKRAEFREARLESLPFRAGWFDAAVAWLVVHLVDRPAAFAELKRVLAPGGRLAVVTFDPSHFSEFWLNRFFPSLEAIDRARFPDREALVAELRAAGFAESRVLRVSQRGSLDREAALRRIRGRHISTFDLLDEEEVRRGTAQAERELPERVEYGIEQLVAIASGP
jgi:SAM-dependent methyltransferase